MSEQITTDLVRLDADLGSSPQQVIQALADLVGAERSGCDPGQLAKDALAREATSHTGLPGGIALPHCRTSGIGETTLAFVRLSRPVDFGAPDGPADLVFLLAHPSSGDDTHFQVLTRLTRSLVKAVFTDALRDAASAEQVVSLVADAIGQRR